MRERVSIDPQIHFGKPCVAGTRIPILSVLELVREGLSFSEIIQDYYPDLQLEDIRACVQNRLILSVDTLREYVEKSRVVQRTRVRNDDHRSVSPRSAWSVLTSSWNSSNV